MGGCVVVVDQSACSRAERFASRLARGRAARGLISERCLEQFKAYVDAVTSTEAMHREIQVVMKRRAARQPA
jgi:hypothetical protein